MKKIFTIIIAATMTAAAWATDTKYSPTAEYNVRPKADGTGWTTSPTAGAASVKADFEFKASACFYAIQQYKVADIKDATSVTLALTNGSGSDALAIWAFKGTFATDMTASAFNTAFENTTGVKPGASGTHTTTYLLKDGANAKTPNSTFIINDAALTTLKSLAGTDGSFTLLITNKTADLDAASSSANRKYQSSNSANANPPVLTVTTPSYVVTNLTTGEGYTDFTIAVGAAVAKDVLQLNENISVSSRINTTVAMTIQGKTGSEVITCTTNATTMLFLPGENAPLTLKNLILDGNKTARTNCAIEASKKNSLLTLQNVTFQNFDRSASGQTQGFICVKGSGSAVLDGCTFKDNAVAAGYGDVFVGLSNALTLKGSNAIGNGIYVQKALYFIDGGATHTTPITVIAASDRGDNTGLGSNKAFIKGTTDTYKYSLSGNASWEIAGNESQNYIYVTKAASTTKTTDKTMSAGKGLKLGTVTIQ